MLERLRQTILLVTYGGLIMAVRLPASSKRSKHQPIGEYPGDYREHDFEDAEASRKVAEEAGYLGKRTTFPSSKPCSRMP